MRSIERRFSSLQQRRPYASSIVNFAAAVKKQTFSRATISRWFRKLVDSDDYARKDRKDILDDLTILSNPVRTTEIGGELPRRGA